MTKTLPININSNHISECWTFYKCCILDTYLEGRKWKSINMGVYIDQNNNAFWGDGNNHYPLEHYDNILGISSASIKNISASKIVSFIENTINAGSYVIMDCDVSKISFSPSDPISIHEIMVFGYNNEAQVFYSPLVDNNSNRCIVVEIPYAKIIAAYSEAREKYLSDINECFNRRYDYFYPITIIKPQQTKLNSNEFIFSLIRKINNEIKGEEHVIKTIDESGSILYTWTIYKGLGCTVRVKNEIESYLNSPQKHKEDIELTKTLLKLHEHKDNILLGVSIAFNELFPGQKNHNLYDKLFSVVQLYKKAYLLSYKCSLTRKETDFKQLCILTAKIMEVEPPVLRSISEELAKRMRESYEYD